MYETIASPSGLKASPITKTYYIGAKRQALLFLLYGHTHQVSAAYRPTLNQLIGMLQNGKPMRIFMQHLNAPTWKSSSGMRKIFDKITTILDNPELCGQVKSSIYDHRSNVILYVIRETHWALAMQARLSLYQDLIISTTRSLLAQIDMPHRPTIDTIKSCFLCFLDIKDEVEKFVVSIIRQNCILDDICISSNDFEVIKTRPPSVIYRYLRSHWCFQKRGRVNLSDSELNATNDSTMNTRAGIASIAVASLIPGADDYFPEEQLHAKNGYRREGDVGLDTFFLDRNIPFISGASGTLTFFFIAYLAQGLRGKPDMEILTLAHIASLILGGHHSTLEVLIVAQAAGLFTELPDIVSSLKEPNFYKEFVTKFSQYIGITYGLPSIDTLMRTTYV